MTLHKDNLVEQHIQDFEVVCSSLQTMGVASVVELDLKMTLGDFSGWNMIDLYNCEVDQGLIVAWPLGTNGLFCCQFMSCCQSDPKMLQIWIGLQNVLLNACCFSVCHSCCVVENFLFWNLNFVIWLLLAASLRVPKVHATPGATAHHWRVLSSLPSCHNLRSTGFLNLQGIFISSTLFITLWVRGAVALLP